MQISILIPAYNEGAFIYENLRYCEQVLSSYGWDYEIIVADDGSRDGTLREIQRAAGCPGSHIRYVAMPSNAGKGQALQTAFTLVSKEIVGFLDADLDIPPEQLKPMLAVLAREHADVVIGDKRHPNSTIHYPATRRLLSWLYAAVLRLLFGLPVRDTQAGIKVCRREVADIVLPRVYCQHYAFDVEFLLNAHMQGFTIRSCPIVVNFRRTMKWGRISFSDVGRMAIDTLGMFYRYRVRRWFTKELKRGPRQGNDTSTR